MRTVPDQPAALEDPADVVQLGDDHGIAVTADDGGDDHGPEVDDVDVDGHGERFTPSLAEIAEACAEIRAAWPAEEFARRWVGPGRVRWRVPGIDQHHERTDRETARAFQSGK